MQIKKLYHVLLALYPILSGYGFSPQADFGALSLLLVGGFYVVKRKEPFRLIFPRGYNVAISHAIKKLVRVIFHLEKSQQTFCKVA